MKAKLLRIWCWTWNGLVIVAVLVVAIVCMAFLGGLQDKYKVMSPEEKAAYTQGYDDAVEGNARVVSLKEEK